MEEVADSWVRGPIGERVWHSVCSFGERDIRIEEIEESQA